MTGRAPTALREGAVTFGGVGVNAALAFVVTWFVGHGLGASGAGQFFLLTAVFSIATSILALGGDTGLVRALSRALAQGERSRLVAFTWVAVLPVGLASSLAAVSLWILAGPAAAALGLGADGASTVRALGLLLVPGALLGLLLGACRGLGRTYTYTGVQNVMVPILRFVAVAFAVYVLVDVELAFVVWVAPLAIGAVLAGVLLVRYLGEATSAAAEVGEREADADAVVTGEVPARAGLAATAREFWGFSLPRGGAVVLERAIDWSDVLLVLHLLGPAAGGIYGVVSRCAMAGTLVEAAVRIVAGPRVSAALARGDLDSLRTLFARATTVLILCAWPFYILLAVCADVVLSIFGTEFATGATALRVICLAMMLSTAGGMLQTFLLMGGRSHWQLMNRGIQWVVLVSLVLVLVPRLGLVGAAVAWLVALLVDTSLAGVQVWRSVGVRSSLRLIVRACGYPVLVTGAGGLALRWIVGDAGPVVLILALTVLVGGYAALVVRRRRAFGLGAIAVISPAPPDRTPVPHVVGPPASDRTT